MAEDVPEQEGRRMESYREQIIALVKAGQSRYAQELCRARGVRIDLSEADLSGQVTRLVRPI